VRGLVRAARVLVASAVTLATGCGDSPGKAWLVDRTRVLGARVEATTEPARASVDPGESARITWLVPSPQPSPLAWAYAACVGASGQFASPRCAGPVLASGSGVNEGPPDELAAMDLVVPPREAVADATELLLLAAFCERAQAPTLDPQTFTGTCADGAEPLLASTRIRLGAAGRNENPAVADDAARVPVDCVRPDGPEIVFGFRFDGREREPGEAIVLSHVVTAGELDRAYSALEPDEAAPKEVTVPWRPPASEGDVKIHFVLRDGRGGTTFVQRTVCVRR